MKYVIAFIVTGPELAVFARAKVRSIFPKYAVLPKYAVSFDVGGIPDPLGQNQRFGFNCYDCNILH